LVREIDSIDNVPIRESAVVCRSAAGNFLVQEGRHIFEFSARGFTAFSPVDMDGISPNFIALNSRVLVYRENSSRTIIRSFNTGRVFYWPYAKHYFQHITFSLVDDSLVYINESTGATEFNVHTGTSKKWLPGREVSRVFRDDEGNLWFTTLGKGLYRLNSAEFKNIIIRADPENTCSVYSVKKNRNELFIGADHNTAYRFILPGFKDSGTKSLHWITKNRILYVDRIKNGDFIIASDFGVHRVYRDFRVVRNNLPLGIKSVFKMNENELLIGTGWGAAIFDLNKFRVMDTLWRERCTTVYFQDGITYVGTLNGLYLVKKDRSYVYAGATTSFLQKRISAMAESKDGTLWIASYDDGIIGYKNGRETVAITSRQGLTSNICLSLYVYNNFLWAGTNKGLNKIDLGRPGYPVTRYTSNDGLGSDVINAVIADSSTVYAATGAGLSIFDEAKTKVSDSCRLYLLAVMNSGKDRIKDTSNLLLPYSDKRIRFEFAAISYRSGANISYRYRLNGLDEAWKDTKDNFLEYPTLPSGDYTLELKAINKFGIFSHLISVHFVVITPFWQSTWFYVLVLILFLSLTWLFVSFRIRGIRKRQVEKEMLNKRMIEMEHMALQSQMNPHLIFNCLNSIQQYIFDQDIYSANMYITKFANLIRATLHHSAKSYISMEDEISYLSTYLSLEKLRFKDKMEYSIEVDPGVDLQTIFIPPMLIQPYVENSIRHGLQPQVNIRGYIKIQLKSAGDKLVVTINDNGIGREQAMQNRTHEHIEYQSRGMSLTADRIRLINVMHGDDIRIEVIDLKDDEDRALGTRVVIHFPRFMGNTQNQVL
jgi:hypothetical protein